MVCPSCGKGKMIALKKGKSKCSHCLYIDRAQVMSKKVKK